MADEFAALFYKFENFKPDTVDSKLTEMTK